MPANLPLRSASTSKADSHAMLNTTSAATSLGATSTTLRSTSIGSSFFHKESSNFFNPNDASNASTNSIEEERASDINQALPSGNVGTALDLVGAIGNLDLYDHLGLSKDDNHSDRRSSVVPDHEIRVENKTPFQQQMFYGENYHLYPYPPQHQASMTPNPAVGSTFGTSSMTQNQTPNTWNNNFIPASAPPFGYGVSNKSNDLPISIRPFQLPEDNAGGESDLFFANNHSSLKFGGVLDSQLQFGGAKHMMATPNKTSGSSSESDIEASDISGTSRVPIGAKGASAIEFMPIGERDTKTSMNSIASNDLMGGQFLNDNLIMPLANMNNIQLAPNMWNQHPIMTPQMHPNSNNSYVDNRSSSHQNHIGNQNSNRFSNRNRNYGNDGANVHRKMHSNRKKGEDASKYANAKLEDFSGEIYSLCKDQHGCRFLQRQLDLGREVSEGKNDSNALTNDIAATMIFNEIYLKIVELMTDPFGNYLIQKLFENVSTDQRIILVKNSAPDFIRIALNPHGTRALQKLVECITTEEESKLIIDSLSSHIVSLSRDLNGNHVVQKCLQKLRPDENQFIFDTASVNCREIATHRHGCCVLQRCLDHGNAKQRQQLSYEVAQNATKLSLDPFGNYVVQYVLSRGDEGSIGIILDHIKSNIVALSLHKFGSNVIEKSLRINTLTNSLIEVLLLNKERFSDLLNDAFGNYVLQTALDVANPDELNKLSQTLQPLLPNIKNTPHGRRILTKIQSM